MKFEIKENQTYKSKEIYFDEKPNESTRDALKALKFRWNGARGIWYGFAAVEEIRAAIGQSETSASAGNSKEEKTARKIAPLWDRVQVSDIPAYGTENDVKKAIRAACASSGWSYDRAAADYFRRHLRERFPEVRFSITSGGAGWLNKCNIEIKSSPYTQNRVKGNPDAIDTRERYDHKENSPALDAVLTYCQKLFDAADEDDGDDYADYGAHCLLYGHVQTDYDYKQTDPTPEQLADIADFEKKKAEADEAERIAAHKRYIEEEKQRERERIEAEEAERKAAETAEKIKNDIIIEDLDEPQQFAFLGMIEASGKQANINEVDEDIAPIDEHGNPRKLTRRDVIISRKITFKTPDLFGKFCFMFYRDFDFLAGFGATAWEDPRVPSYDDYIKLTREQAQTVHTFTTNAIAVYDAQGVPQFVIDPQGYGYARYILRFDIADGETPEIMPAAEYLKKCRETAESLQPFYVPAPLSEQIETANIKAGETVSIIQIDPWICCAQHINGTITEATATTRAQYQDSARVEIIPSGKRKPTTLHPHSGSAFAMYRGTLPDVPQSLKYKQFGENMRISLFAGEYADDYIKNAIDYYHKIGFDPIINTIPR